MRNFWSYISNDQYSIGCTGQTVHVYDKEGSELAKFKDLKYAYNAAFCPTKNIFIVRATEAYFAVYSLDTLSLIKKIKFSRVNAAQDDGYCFSADGRYFFDIERHGDSTNSAIAVYDTEKFERRKLWLAEDKVTEPSYIESDSTGQIFVLGFLRGTKVCIRAGFVAKLGEQGLTELREIPEREYDYYRDYKSLELMGFTAKAKQWSGFVYRDVDITDIEKTKRPLAELWERAGERKCEENE